MPSVHRLKHSFTSGELSPLMEGRVDFKRFGNGCRKLKNAVCLTQGAAQNRSGFEFIYDLTSLGLDVANPEVRQIPFVFNELQAYTMVFFRHTDGDSRMVLGYRSAGLVLAPGGGSVFELVIPAEWDIVAMDYAQSGDEVYIAQSGESPKVIQRLAHDDWQIETPVFVDPPADWNITDGYPERVTFHQQRLVFGANITYRQRQWLSQSGSFLDFSVNNPLLDSDAITFTLDSGTQNKIMWNLSVKELNIGTMGGEWTVIGGTLNAITPTNVIAQRQTSNGSEAINPLLVGNSVLFVERHGKSINEFVYDSTYDSYKNFDITILAPHLTEHYGIVDWTYQQSPHSIVWSVRGDGVLLGLTFQREHEVIGWHQHDTQGEFLSLTTIPGSYREDELWAVIKREIEGADKYYLERLSTFYKGNNLLDCRFMDSFQVYDGVPVTELSGLDHLEGKLVAILADGAPHPDRTVEGGMLYLDNEYSHVVVGLYYESEIRPFLMDIQDDKGTALGRVQRVTTTDILLYNSLNMWVGRDDYEDGEFEEEIPFRNPWDTTGQGVPLFSGIKHLAHPEGFDRKSEYFIRQKDPLPLTVLAVVDTIEVSGG